MSKLPVGGGYFGTADSPEIELRRALLLCLGILDTGPEPAFEGITRAAALVSACPVAALSLLDGDRLWFKSLQGAQAEAALRHGLHYQGALEAQGWIEVADLPARAPFAGEHDDTPALRYLAALPVRLEGFVVGVLCVADHRARPPLDEPARAALRGLGAATEALLAGRRPGQESDARALRHRRRLLSRLSHELRSPLTAVRGYTQLLLNEPTLTHSAQALAWLGHIETESGRLDALVDELLGLSGPPAEP
jgi:signal transduction histidine kinase